MCTLGPVLSEYHADSTMTNGTGDSNYVNVYRYRFRLSLSLYWNQRYSQMYQSMRCKIYNKIILPKAEAKYCDPVNEVCTCRRQICGVLIDFGPRMIHTRIAETDLSSFWWHFHHWLHRIGCESYSFRLTSDENFVNIFPFQCWPRKSKNHS